MLSRYSLRTLLLTGAFLIAIIPAAVLGIGSARAVRALIMSAEMENGELLAKGLASEYEQFLSLHLRATSTLAAHAAAAESYTQATLTPLLVRTRVNYPAVLAVFLTDHSGKLIARDPLLTEDGKSSIGIDVSDRAYFKELLQTKRPVVDKTVVIGKALRKPVVVMVAPILDGTGRVKGAAAFSLGLDQIQTLAARIRHGKSGHTVVTSGQGLALAHPEAGRVEKLEDISKLPVWPLVTAKESGQMPSFIATTGDERLGGFATVPEVGWKVWVSHALSEVEGEVASTYRQVVVWALVALLGALGVALLVNRAIARPIRGVQSTATAIADGDLTQQAPEQGPAEVVSLARAFNQMAATLRQLLTTEREGKALPGCHHGMA